MGLHDNVHVGGVSESCRYNDHSDCRAPGCGCTCHAPAPNIPPSIGSIGPEKACPKCGVKRPFAETYCRIDGERLASLLCGVCGAGMNPEDCYCYKCGSPKGEVASSASSASSISSISSIPTVPAIEEVDYGQQVLRGLQKELGNVQVDEANNRQGQVIVEQPAGTQGSFKLVNQPNPNKIRGPVRSVPPTEPRAPVRPIRRLPIKPS